jgi:hypothetical protein
MAFLKFFELLFKSKVFFISNGVLKRMPDTGSQGRISSKIGRLLLFEWGFGLLDVIRIHLIEKGKLEGNIKNNKLALNE